MSKYPFSILKFNDFRKLLRSLYEYHKKNSSTKFSYRYLTKKAGLSSSSFLKHVIDGERNISKQTALKLAKAFNFNKQETKFFENLVFMNQSKTSEDKAFYYNNIIKIRKLVNPSKVEAGNFKYFSKWYYAVIREIIIMQNGETTANDIGKMIIPKLSKYQVTKAIVLLSKLKLIYKDKNGKWKQTKQFLSINSKIEPIIIHQFQKEMMRLGINAIDIFPKEQRDISTLTLRTSSKKISQLKKKIKDFRKALMEFVNDDSPDDQVVQINFSMFPLTQIIK